MFARRRRFTEKLFRGLVCVDDSILRVEHDETLRHVRQDQRLVLFLPLQFGDLPVDAPLLFFQPMHQRRQLRVNAVIRAAVGVYRIDRRHDLLRRGRANAFDGAGNAFVSAYREYDNETDFHVKVEYLASPRIEGKVLILADPMLATGASMELAYHALLGKGTPKELHLVSVIASRQAIEYVRTHFPADTTLWVAAIDDTLNEHKYIVPGLGDAGDLAFGTKDD